MVDATDLKSVRANSSVWVRIPSSAPSERLFKEGKSLQLEQIFGRAEFRNKKHESEAYLPSIRQVTSHFPDVDEARLRRKHGQLCRKTLQNGKLAFNWVAAANVAVSGEGARSG